VLDGHAVRISSVADMKPMSWHSTSATDATLITLTALIAGHLGQRYRANAPARRPKLTLALGPGQRDFTGANAANWRSDHDGSRFVR